MGVVDRPKLLRPSTRYTHSLKEIRDSFSKDKRVITGVDVSPWIVAVLNHKESLDEQFMEPRVPVLAVAKYVQTFCLLLINNNIQPILVFDGQRVPLKTDTNEKRYKYLEQDIKKLEEMYQHKNMSLVIRVAALIRILFNWMRMMRKRC